MAERNLRATTGAGRDTRAKSSFGLTALSLLLCLASVSWADGGDRPLDELTLEELMQVSVASASRIAVQLDEAPATVIVVDRAQIAEHGYRDLSELLADLPGMDIVRPYGATYLKNYWRGFRSSIGSPYLLMLDGTVLNHLYFNTTDVMVALPLTSIERVEVVYGPASSVYGANAFMGVVHVISRRDTDYATARVEIADEESTTVDGAAAWSAGDWRFRAALRFSEAELDPSQAGRSTYSEPELLREPRLWGGFLDDPGLAGRFSSPERFVGVDLRAIRGGLELALQTFQTRTGYGLEYAFDQAQPHAIWDRYDHSLSGRYCHDLGPRVMSTTFLRYRESGVGDASTFVEGFVGERGGVPTRLIDFSRWHADNSSLTLSQDFEIEWSDKTALSTGVRFEQKDLQKAYEVIYGPSLPPAEVQVSTYPFPARRDVVGPPNNRIDTEELGLYVQARHQLAPRHAAHLGLRWDDTTVYGSAATVRLGYVGTFGSWIFKALFGEGYQEPNPRVLYGGWRGSGSDPELDPESSQTTEVSVSHTRPRLRHVLSLYEVENRDTIVNLAGGADNLGRRQVSGVDYHFEALPISTAERRLRLWLYYTHLFDADEEEFDPHRTLLGEVPIGDVARDQLHIGASTRVAPWSASLLGHWVDARDTVASNPIEEIDSFATVDLVVRYELPAEFEVGVRVANLFDEAYSHPGVRGAAAGESPGFFDAQGLWQGAGGFFSSSLPQPGRQVGLHLRWRQ